MARRLLTTNLLLSLAFAVLAALLCVSGALADATTTTTTTAPSTETTESAEAATPSTTTVPAPAPAPVPTPVPSEPSPTTTGETTVVPAPEVKTQLPQQRTVVPHVKGKAPATAHRKPAKGASHKNAVSPSAVTPPLPSTLGASVSGVPSFFINSFSIPPFLLPIYQAAGAAYGIPWQVLAAINEVETDYGRDLSVSSAGAEGWMQFLPSEWGQYGVDVNNDGFEDPNNPADAIFAAARYLKAAGGGSDIRTAVFSYNHSQAYVNSVMLRARLLGGTPPELLGAITGLTEARFPVYAPSHYSDGFPTTEGVSPKQVAGTTIYSQAGAPVIAVQDGVIVQISQSGPLGPSISLRDAYGNTYTYSGLGTLATLYPVLEALGAKGTAATAGSAQAGTPAVTLGSGSVAGAPTISPATATRVFRAGSDNVYLHPLRVGVSVIAGTVLGHVGDGTEPHVVFQIRPSGIGAALIDPKPILDGWVKLQATSVVKATGRDPFATISPTPGQALLESKTQLEQQLPKQKNIRIASCERRLIEDGQVERRVLAALEFLAASGLKPTVSAHSCPHAASATQGGATRDLNGTAFDISAVDGTPVASPGGPVPLVTTTVRKLLGLQGAMKPLEIASSTRIPGVPHSVASPGYAGLIHVAFTPLGGGSAHAAGIFSPGLSPHQWIALVARLGQVPDPTVSPKPSAAAIPDQSSASKSASAGGN